MLYADFKTMLKAMGEQYRKKMYQIKAEPKGKTPYTERINIHVPSGWSVNSTFAYGDLSDPLKMYRGKDYVEKFIEHIKDEVKPLHASFP